MVKNPLPVFLLCVVASLGGSCAHERFEIERPQPTDERIRELLRAPVPNAKQAAKATAFTLTLYPRIILEGQAVSLTCYVPESYGAGRIRVALEGIEASEHILDRIEHRMLIQHIPCGTYTATCAVATSTGRRERREQSLIVQGGMCDNGNK